MFHFRADCHPHTPDQNSANPCIGTGAGQHGQYLLLDRVVVLLHDHSICNSVYYHCYYYMYYYYMYYYYYYYYSYSYYSYS